MTTFNNREQAFEAKHARDEDMAFRVVARRNKLVGQWAAALIGLSGKEADSYAKAVVTADFEEVGDDDVIRKLVSDFTRAGLAHDEAAVRAALAEQAIEARRQLTDQE